jgi:excisionase family DNA binding protein
VSDRLLNASEVAEMLAVPERWVREHTRGGLVPHVRLGRYVRYRREAVLEWVSEQEDGGAKWRKHRPRPAAELEPASDSEI